jgi:ParB family transcriptional regulator, chromosome partitioning protein
MMARKRGLGRGLDALIPGSKTEGNSEGVLEIAIENIIPNPRQPRSQMDSDLLEELAESILEYGVIQPLIVTQGEQETYTLIAGERRLEAARRAGLDTVPVLVREASDQQRLELALIENVQRADLSPLETAEAYRQLAEDFDLSHEEIAQRVGKSRVSVTNTLRLLKLPLGVQKALAEVQISEGHARALLALPSPQSQSAVLTTIIQKGLNVRQTEELVRKLGGQKPPKKVKLSPAPEIIEVQERLQQSLGTRVSLNARVKGQGGTITIHYYSDEELNTLIDRLINDLE